MHNFEANYNKILETLQLNIDESNFITQRRKPKLSDIELIAIDLTAEYMGVDSEHQLFRDLQSTRFFNLIDRTVYNRRKRGLVNHIKKIRVILSEKFNQFEDYFVVDSMPLEACKLSRSSRSKICKEHFHSAPDRGFCASQQMHFYGYKLHAVCSVQGVFKSLDISKASVHDIHYLKDIKQQLSNCVLLGDKGYLSKSYQIDLFETAKINHYGLKIHSF